MTAPITPDLDALGRRLREYRNPMYTFCIDAADAIDTLRAQLAAVTAERDAAIRDVERLRDQGASDSQVFFYEREWYVLSNFSAFRVRWLNADFDTAEHVYHWEKFRQLSDWRIAAQIRHARSAHEALKIAEQYRAVRRPDWDAIKVSTMRAILRAKVDQHEYVRRKLLETGGRELIENSWRDDFRGWGWSGNGSNMLGKLWMEIRAECRAALADRTP